MRETQGTYDDRLQPPFISPDSLTDEDTSMDLPSESGGENEASETEQAEEKEAAVLQPSPQLNQDIIEAANEYSKWKAERKQINANMQAVVERMETKGIPAEVFRKNVKELELSEDQRKARDNANAVTRAALGIPVQVDMLASKYNLEA